MPLPEKVVEQIGRESPQSPGWSYGLISFSAGILAITILLWLGLTLGYKPYLDSQTASIEDQINQENQAISPTDQANLINYYSQISNLRALLRNHQPVSAAFTWIEGNTEANTYYSSFTLTNGNQISLTAESKTEADANQQIAIFESSPQISNLTVTAPNISSQAGYWEFTVTMSIDPSIFSGTTSASSTP